MHLFSSNPLRGFNNRTTKVTALATLAGLVVLSSVSYIQNKPTYPTTLAGYYKQKLDWQSCYTNYSCAELLVPIDYKHLRTGTFHISVLKYEAQNPKNRIGSLIVNPGGPGASGVDYAYSAEYLFSPDILERYDIVGFDPRGVSRSEPIRCLSDKELDANYASDSKPDNKAELEKAIRDAKSYIATCIKKNKYIQYYGTENSARDMDILRAAVGDKELNYMGKSYGTYLGTLYTNLFPNKVGRMVLDGAVDPTATSYEMTLAQAIGFDQALASFEKDCKRRAGCELPDSFTEFFNKLAKHPLPIHGNKDRKLTESLAVLGTASALYDSENGWSKLRMALKQAKVGYGNAYIQLADQYSGRLPNDSYSNNEFDSGAVIDCLDSSSQRAISQIKKDAKAIESKAPVFGPYLAYGELTCSSFKHKTGKTIPAHIPTKNPILILGTTRDPATPYKWAQALIKTLTNSKLLTFNGDGHTSQGRGNTCIDSAVDSFYLEKKIPQTSTCN